MLDELIARLRSGELSLDEFAQTAADNFVYADPAARPYPETDGDENLLTGVSGVTITVAVRNGELTRDEADAIYAALAPRGS